MTASGAGPVGYIDRSQVLTTHPGTAPGDVIRLLYLLGRRTCDYCCMSSRTEAIVMSNNNAESQPRGGDDPSMTSKQSHVKTTSIGGDSLSELGGAVRRVQADGSFSRVVVIADSPNVATALPFHLGSSGVLNVTVPDMQSPCRRTGGSCSWHVREACRGLRRRGNSHHTTALMVTRPSALRAEPHPSACFD